VACYRVKFTVLTIIIIIIIIIIIVVFYLSGPVRLYVPVTATSNGPTLRLSVDK